MSAKIELALRFAAQGWKLFPQDRNKRPLIKDWPNQASSDSGQIRAWAKQFPKANFAVACGKRSGMIGLDIDVKNGGHGKGSFILLQREHEKIDTMTTRTPSGGGHLYFGYPDGVDRVPNLLEIDGFPGIELKGDGGAMTLPGSFYSSGAEYVLTQDGEPADCPGWLLKLMQNGKNNRKSWSVSAGDVPEGRRNVHLASLAGSLRRQGASAETIVIALNTENETHCSPPLPAVEVMGIVESISRYQAANPVEPVKDYGHAAVLAERFLGLYRWAPHRGSWMEWIGSVWKPTEDERLAKIAADTLRNFYAEQLSAAKDKPTIGRLLALVRETCVYVRIIGALSFLKGRDSILTRFERWDAEAWVLNCGTGTIDQHGGKNEIFTTQS